RSRQHRRLMGQSPFGDSPFPSPYGDGCFVDALLELDGGTCLLELRLDRVGLFLREALLDRIGRAVDEVFRLLEAETGDCADDFDHLDLLSAGLVQDDVERDRKSTRLNSS